uniref:Amino acid transporter transmembrane domain-containing protein n=1 Tax=Plectus sambesii TaxID=2011161 RepID=A0A914UXV5_9BILA
MMTEESPSRMGDQRRGDSIHANAVDEYEEHLEAPLLARPPGTVTATRTLMNFLRGMIGPGCLALPVAFKQAGLWTGFILVFVLGFLNYHCMNMLVHSAHYLCDKSGKLELDYGHLAKKAVDYGIYRWRPHSRKALYLVNVCIAMLQIGVGSVLYVFMASHIKEVLEHYDHVVSMNLTTYMLIILIPLVLINSVRTLRVLAVFSTVGNILMVIAFVIIFQALIRPGNFQPNLPSITHFSEIAVACGSILYAFEGQAMILPMENKMRHPEDMIRPYGVLWAGMSLVTITYVATGFFGFMVYGEDVQGSITLNLPDIWVYDVVKVILVVVVYVGYVIQLYIVVEMIWPAIRRKVLGRYQSIHLLLEYVFRALLVLLTLAIALVVPKLELIIPLVGVSSGMLLAFVFPPIIETMTFWPEWELMSRWEMALRVGKNVVLIFVGIFGLVVGMSSSIDNIIRHHDS